MSISKFNRLNKDIYFIMSMAFILYSIQAFFFNILDTRLPVFHLYLGYLFLINLKYLYKIDSFLKFTLIYFLLAEVVLFILYFIIVDHTNTFIFFRLLIAYFILILTAIMINKDTTYNSKKIFAYTITVFFILSLVIHLFFWDYFANIFYFKIKSDEAMYGLKILGFVDRLYSLFFNPLTTAFTFFILFLILIDLKYRNYYIIFFIFILSILAFSRAAIVAYFLFFSLVAIMKSSLSWKFTFFILVVIMLTFIQDIPILSNIYESITTGKDSQGSAQVHSSDIEYGINMIFNIGNGFFNLKEGLHYIESWILGLGAITGYSGNIMLSMFLGTILYKAMVLKNKTKLYGLVSVGVILLLFPMYRNHMAVFFLGIYLFQTIKKEKTHG